MSKFLKFLRQLPKRVLVLLTAAPTWLVGLATIVTALSDKIVEVFPDSQQTVSRVTLVVLAAIASAVAIVRRVTPVIKALRGLLPIDDITTDDGTPGQAVVDDALHADLAYYVNLVGPERVNEALRTVVKTLPAPKV